MKNKKAIIVDDSPTIRKIVVSVCNNLGITEIDEYSDGQEFWDNFSCEKDCAHFIISDFHMPNMDGLALIKKVREKCSKIKIILLSTENHTENIAQCLKSGANDCVYKTYNYAKLNEDMERVLIDSGCI